jgi:hypothetical protein
MGHAARIFSTCSTRNSTSRWMPPHLTQIISARLTTQRSRTHCSKSGLGMFSVTPPFTDATFASG